jgi:hypothetical protein
MGAKYMFTLKDEMGTILICKSVCRSADLCGARTRVKNNGLNFQTDYV